MFWHIFVYQVWVGGLLSSFQKAVRIPPSHVFDVGQYKIIYHILRFHTKYRKNILRFHTKSCENILRF